jgi:hypothetical protein
MASGVSRWYLTAAGFLTSRLPFSVSQFFIVFAALSVPVFIAGFFISLKKRGKKTLWRLSDAAAVILAFLFIYNLSVGFAYHRKPLDLSAEYAALTDEYVEAAADYFISDFAGLARTLPRDSDGNVVSPYSHAQLNDKLAEEFKRIDNAYLSDFTPRAKEVSLSAAMTNLNIAGFFLGVFGEANVSTISPEYAKPFHAAHEMSHAKGVMREFEADLTASYLLLSSADPFLRYSGYMINYGYILSPTLYIVKEDAEGVHSVYSELYEKIPEAVEREFQNARDLYARYGLLDEFGRKMNDLYLKINGQEKGADSYDDPGESVEVPSDPTNPESPIETVYQYSETQKIIFSLYSLI